ncbi:asparagine synthase-related protein [Sphingorhabdus sp.]|uniref:asparagine synthase-related protein n=1 Tax=Sphingorhabdus sp. TaxID=1902408 RepID=UPI003BAF2D84
MKDRISAQPRASGIYGMFNLDGAPIKASDAEWFGQYSDSEIRSWLVSGHDAHFSHAVSFHDGPAGFTVLVGEIEEADDLALELGVRRSSPAAYLAQTAFDRFGSNLPAILIGEWSLLHRALDGSVTLMISAAQRDLLFYAKVGKRLAVAPNLFVLGKIGWVDNAIEEAGLLFPLGRAKLRKETGDRTMFKAVRQLESGSTVTIYPDGRIVRRIAQTLIEQPRWTGNFSDAVVETELLLRRIMRTRIERSGCVVSLLSGGLDSSLLAWLCAEEHGSTCRTMAMTSVAPDGSEIADESHFADLVANHLGLASHHVFPAFEANIYRPTEAIFVGCNGPMQSNRHCLTEAFQIAAKQAGASLLVNGTYGEMSLTARLPASNPFQRLRTIAARLKHTVYPRHVATSEASAFHVRLAPHRIANLPEPVRSALSCPAGSVRKSSSTELLGYISGVEKALRLPNEFRAGAVRMDYPYRDIRLLRLFAGFPLQMLVEGNADRGIARQMLARRIPDSIRLRRRGMPASPDHMARLQRQAGEARQRIPHFRKAEVGDWLDIDWLDTALANVAARGALSFHEANEVQFTAMTAEFLLWWRLQS